MWMVIKLSKLLKLGQMLNPGSLQDIQRHHVDSQIHFRQCDQLLSQHTEPQGWAPRDSAMHSRPGITFTENPSFIKHGLVILHLPHLFCKAMLPKLCIQAMWQQQSLTVTRHFLTAVTRFSSPVFMAAELCFLLKTSWFNGVNSDAQHRSGT